MVEHIQYHQVFPHHLLSLLVQEELVEEIKSKYKLEMVQVLNFTHHPIILILLHSLFVVQVAVVVQVELLVMVHRNMEDLV
jgi:hypothetical protein|tara:strand:- start:745 stop:987 length:243 start_codon:yes stop_codon:yes gene_type:complete